MKIKKQLFSILFLVPITLAYSQFDKEFTKRNWKVGKEKTIFNNPVTRLEGYNDTYTVTNIGIKTIEQLIDETQNKAKSEMWTKEKTDKTIVGYKEIAQGGVIYIYLGRITLDSAKLENFTVIVMDSDDETELIRKELTGGSPSVPSSSMLDLWTNMSFVPIDKENSGEIFVYVIDRLGDSNKKFKFHIKV
ncbi:hypothetical protein H4O18_04100 [Arenibacter sp. BSSL-BM3]|uniref:Uncharacterized protein n=1 Tax=Arenibacter arenosicollis TaxID=2762274 RepID=A0ABR7QJ09_9FLAO|nr:hypothetical protein [Arenibacter arenosicollis]MBC8767166.1 hypothetical protein [Arenibacter arenosicollis]